MFSHWVDEEPLNDNNKIKVEIFIYFIGFDLSQININLIITVLLRIIFQNI